MQQVQISNKWGLSMDVFKSAHSQFLTWLSVSEQILSTSGDVEAEQPCRRHPVMSVQQQDFRFLRVEAR